MTSKTAILGAILALAATPVLADASIVDAIAKKKLAEVSQPDPTLGQYDADFEIILAERGVATGTAIYGQSDADYDAYLTPADFFATAALGDHDADYEIVLAGREPLGAAYFENSTDFAALELR